MTTRNTIKRFDPMDIQTATITRFTTALRMAQSAGMDIRDIINYGLSRINEFTSDETSDEKDYRLITGYGFPSMGEDRRERNRMLAAVDHEHNYWHISLPALPRLCKPCRSSGYLDGYVPAKKCRACNGSGYIIEKD